MRVKVNFKLSRDTNYYFGLFLLILASASIVWAFFNDGFDPEDFLVYFLIYAWGFTLLLKSDSEFRLRRLEEAMTSLQSRCEQIEKTLNRSEERTEDQEEPASEFYQEFY
jgi:hypothetical protein